MKVKVPFHVHTKDGWSFHALVLCKIKVFAKYGAEPHRTTDVLMTTHVAPIYSYCQDLKQGKRKSDGKLDATAA